MKTLKSLRFYLLFFSSFCLCQWTDSDAAINKSGSKTLVEIALTDSLQSVIDLQVLKLDSLNAIVESQKLNLADLREQAIKLDDYRKKLEGNVDSFKGENLKLNQSNRILHRFIFNCIAGE